MSYTVSFYHHVKKRNSTALPGDALASLTCGLKDNASLLQPTLSINLGAGNDFPVSNWNYFYIAAWGRYYWITDVEFLHGVWYVSGVCDVLASWKTSIGATNAIIKRAESLYNPYLPDPYLPIENNPTVVSTQAAIGLNATGCVIVTVAGASTGSSSYFAMTNTAWAELYESVFTNNFANNYKNFWDAIVTDVQNVIFNPSDYISNAIWIPIAYSSVSGTDTSIFLGYVDTGIHGLKINPGTLLYGGTHTLTPPDHPQYSTVAAFLNGNGYRRIQLVLPGYGNIVLDSDAMVRPAQNQIIVTYGIDVTGTLYYHVNAGGIDHILSCDISTPVGFGNQKNNPVAAIGAVGNAVGSALTGNAAGLISSTGSAFLNMIPQYERISTGGSRVITTVTPNIILNAEMYNVIPVSGGTGTGSQIIGRPCGQVTTIGSCSGYLECSNASISCAATEREIQEINNYLNEGFFYE